MALIDICVAVDTEGLRKKYPNGIPMHKSADDLSPYFTILVDKEHRYDDPDDKHDTGIKCEVGDILCFRAIAKDTRRTGVLVIEFADKISTGTDPTSYMSRPTFRTNEFAAPIYDNNGITQPFVTNWQGWWMWNATVKQGANVDPFMTLFANADTLALAGQHIQYTLGFQVYYQDCTLDFWFDPYIRILR